MPSNTRKKRSVAGGRRINVGDVPTHPLTSAPYPANPPMPVVIPRAIGSGVCSSRPSAEAPTRVIDNPMMRSVRSPPPPPPPRRSPPSLRPPLSAFHPDSKRSMSVPRRKSVSPLITGFPRRQSPPTEIVIESHKQDPRVIVHPEFEEKYSPSQEKFYARIPPPSAKPRRRRTSMYGYEGPSSLDLPYLQLPATTIMPKNIKNRRMSEPVVYYGRLGNGRRGRAVGKGVCSSRPSAEEPKPEGPRTRAPPPQKGPKPSVLPPPRRRAPAVPPAENPAVALRNVAVVANPMVAAQAPANPADVARTLAWLQRGHPRDRAARMRRDPAATLDADQLAQELPPYGLDEYSEDSEDEFRARGRGHPTMRQEVSGAPRPPRVFAPKDRIDNSQAEGMALMQSLGIPEDMMGMMTGSGSVKSRRKSSRKTM